jgi:hypothetical protein
VQLLRLGFVSGFRRSSYALAVGRNEVDPPTGPRLRNDMDDGVVFSLCG